MPFELIICLILVIIAISTFVRASIGFGDALVAIPLMAFFIELNQAKAIIVLLSLPIGLIMMMRNWHNIKFKSIWRLLISAAIAIPIGHYVLSSYETTLKILLGLLVILFGLFSLFKPKLYHLKSERPAYLFGLISGLSIGAFNIGGPPVVIYGTLKQWDPKVFSVTLQGFFTPCTIMVMAQHGLSGWWSKEVLIYTAAALPVMLIFVIIGRLTAEKLPADLMRRTVHVFLVIIGASLIIKELMGLFQSSS